MKSSPNVPQAGIPGNTALITVAICTYNRYALLRTLVATLSDQTLSRSMFEILIVDNTDNEADRELYAKEVHGQPGLEVVYSSPPGLSRARNVALEKCRTEYIVFIDDDALPGPEWLASLLGAFRQSDASVVAGPIEPVWPGAKPDWLPRKYLACLTILDYGTSDRLLSEYEFAYGTNMAFKTRALREAGGFNVSLGRIGGRTLISDEEVETQITLRSGGHKVFYSAAARVYHRVHENRLSRNYFRARMAWQAVSTLMHDSPLWWREQSYEEIARASADLGVSEFVQRLFAPTDAGTFSAQINLIYHLFLVTLDLNNEADAVFEQRLSALAAPASADVTPSGGQAPYIRRTSAPIGPDTRHLFADSPSAHVFLFDLYAEIPGTQLISFPANLWDRCDNELEYLENSLGPQIQTLTFTTLEPFVYGPRWPGFDALLNRLDIPVLGILHRLPWTADHAAALQNVAKRVQIIVLAESMVDSLRDTYGISNVIYLPLHPTHAMYIGLEKKGVRERIGAAPGQIIFSILGEAREGKGIGLLLAALDHLAPEDRARMFFLFGGRAKDIDADSVQGKLEAARCAGFADLRQSAGSLNFAVLTEQELGQYINVTDVGVLLYQDDQRKCMSGVLPNYAWGQKPVIATDNSIVGRLVRKYGLGLALRTETPQVVAEALTAMLRAYREGTVHRYANESFRAMISTEAVVRRFSSILCGEIISGTGTSPAIAKRPVFDTTAKMADG